jgi:hypothetical protein
MVLVTVCSTSRCVSRYANGESGHGDNLHHPVERMAVLGGLVSLVGWLRGLFRAGNAW